MNELEFDNGFLACQSLSEKFIRCKLTDVSNIVGKNFSLLRAPSNSHHWLESRETDGKQASYYQCLFQLIDWNLDPKEAIMLNIDDKMDIHEVERLPNWSIVKGRIDNFVDSGFNTNTDLNIVRVTFNAVGGIVTNGNHLAKTFSELDLIYLQ